MPTQMRKALQALRYVLIGLFLFLFFLLPMKSVQGRLGISEVVLEKYYVALVAFTVLLTILTSLFIKYFELLITPKPGVTLPFKAPRKSLFIKLTLATLALTLLVRAVLGIERPFDMDELQFAVDLSQGNPLGSLLYDATHPISSWLSMLSTKVFGLSMWSIRLPSLFFCVGFLILLIKFSLKNVSAGASILLFAHLASSSIFTWYFHSARGYAAMIFFAFLLFSIIYSVTQNKEPLTKKTTVALILSLLLLPLTHGFAILFGLLLPIAITAWFVANEKTLVGQHRREVSRLNHILLGFAPLLAVCLAYMFSLQARSSSKYIGMSVDSPVASDNASRAIATVLGSGHTITLKIIALTSLFLLYILIKRKRWMKDITLFILITFIGFILFQKTVFSTFMVGRFLLGALPLFVFWLAQNSFLLLDPKKLKIAVPLLAVSLVAFPIIDGKPSLFQLPHEEYYYFLKSARNELKGIPKKCLNFSYSGEAPAESEAYVAEKFFFSEGKKEEACPKEYQLHFAWPWQTDETYSETARRVGTISDLPSEKKYRLLQTDGQGRFLAEIQKN